MPGIDYDVGVIGAGPYGLALAAHLRARGVGAAVFGRPMSSWLERMPRGMFLKSEGFASNIADPESRHTLRRYCAELGLPYGDCGDPIPIDTFTDYGLWFQRALVPDVMEDEVEHVRSLGGRFELSLADGATSTVREIVVACGFPRFRHIPSELRDLPPELVSHSSDHAELADFGGRSVVVLGAGQSALETAALLHEHGADVSVVSRKPRGPLERATRGRRPSVCAVESARPARASARGGANVVYAELPPAVFSLPGGDPCAPGERSARPVRRVVAAEPDRAARAGAGGPRPRRCEHRGR